MSTFYLISLLALVASCSAQSLFFGGASSIQDFARDIVNDYNKKVKTDIPTYASVGSGQGISGFLNGTFKIGASDDPLSNAQYATGRSKGGLYTLPFTLTTYSVMTKKSSSLRLTAKQIASIYKKGGITSWKSLNSKLSGNIVPVARLDGSGTTKVFSEWLKKTETWITPSTASFSADKTGFFKTTISYASGTSGVRTLMARNVNAIGYIQTGAGLKGGLRVTAIKNPAGSFVKASDADPAQSIPRPLPASDANWNGVDLLSKAGKATYPLVSFVYAFALKKAGSRARAFLTYTQSSAAQNLVNTRYDGTLFRLPSSVTIKNSAAIKKIT